MIIEYIFRYFAFIAVGIGLVNLVAMRARLSRPAIIFYSIFTAMFLVWGLCQLLGGYGSWFFVFSAPLSEPFVAGFWLIYFAFLWGTTAWVLWGNGAIVLAESGLMHGQGLQRPIGVKLFFAAFSVFFPIVLWFMRSSGAFSNINFP